MGHVTIIGAGPAGAVAAKTLAEKGITVTVFEKGPLKREKPCGGGVPEVVLKEFSLHAQGTPVYGVLLYSPQNNMVALTQKERAGITVMRSSFDYSLMQQAEKAGAHIKAFSYAEPLLENGVLKGVKTETSVHKSDIVIACDGSSCTFAKKMGLYTGTDKNQAVAFQYHMKLDDNTIKERIGNVLELYFGNQWVPLGYTWIFPKEGFITVGNATWLRAVKRERINLKQLLDHFIVNHPVACKKLEDATIINSQSGVLTFSGVVKSVYGDHFLIAGDAGGFISYATGGGLYYAMVTGKIAGEVAAEAVEQNDFSRKFLQQYKKRVDKAIGADMKWGYFMRKLFLDYNIGQEQFVKAIQKNEWIRDLSVLLLKEEIRYDRFLQQVLFCPHKLVKGFFKSSNNKEKE
jgi:digeranylgeranylglycerophospholipid reductase